MLFTKPNVGLIGLGQLCSYIPLSLLPGCGTELHDGLLIGSLSEMLNMILHRGD
jgi:hypothetical protein